MKKSEVEIGATYIAKVSGKLVKIKITGEASYGGWIATNTATGRDVHIHGSQRLRRQVVPISPEVAGVARNLAVAAAEQEQLEAATPWPPGPLHAEGRTIKLADRIVAVVHFDPAGAAEQVDTYARLFAAAPQMAKALAFCLSVLAALPPAELSESMAIEKAQAALAAAKGEA